jgi:hypothetical protein
LVLYFVLPIVQDIFPWYRLVLIKVVRDDFFGKKTMLIIFLDVIAALLASMAAAISIIFFNAILHLIGNRIYMIDWHWIVYLGYTGQDRIHATRPSRPNATAPLVGEQATGPQRSQNNGVGGGNYDKIERATSPVDQRIINEFYSDQPKDMHQYQLNGRQYVVYEGNSYGDIAPYRNGKLDRRKERKNRLNSIFYS